MAEETARALEAGLRLAAQFNPVAAFAGALVAAMLAGHRDADRSHSLWAVGVLLGAWLVGDGARVLARARDVFDGAAGLATPAVASAMTAGSAAFVGADYLALAVWALGGLALGYAFPAWAGAFVGRRVTRGTGWLAAGAVAAAVSVAVAGIAAGMAH